MWRRCGGSGAGTDAVLPVDLAQLMKEFVIVTGEIARVHERTVFCAEHILPLMREVLQPIGNLRKERNGAQALFRLCFVFRDTGLIMIQIDSAVDGQGSVRDVGILQAEQLTRRTPVVSRTRTARAIRWFS